MCAMLKGVTAPSRVALRLSVVKRGCTGLTHKIDIVVPDEKDEVVNIRGILDAFLLS